LRDDPQNRPDFK
jgi:ankyrin repeat protein